MSAGAFDWTGHDPYALHPRAWQQASNPDTARRLCHSFLTGFVVEKRESCSLGPGKLFSLQQGNGRPE
jgi:hypothetical protein